MPEQTYTAVAVKPYKRMNFDKKNGSHVSIVIWNENTEKYEAYNRIGHVYVTERSDGEIVWSLCDVDTYRTVARILPRLIVLFDNADVQVAGLDLTMDQFIGAFDVHS